MTNFKAPMWLEYITHYTAAPAAQPVLTVLEKPLRSRMVRVKDGNLEHTRVHIWNDYANGERPTSGTWEVYLHYHVHFENTSFEMVALNYPGIEIYTRQRSQVCTEAEFTAWVAGLNAASPVTAAVLAKAG